MINLQWAFCIPHNAVPIYKDHLKLNCSRIIYENSTDYKMKHAAHQSWTLFTVHSLLCSYLYQHFQLGITILSFIYFWRGGGGVCFLFWMLLSCKIVLEDQP